MKKAYLILENGDVYAGNSIGVPGDSVGEVVFTTGMGSYMETLTDPSYYGQIITQTFPLIGNYGAISADSESRRAYCRGYIVRELCRTGSNFRKECELGDWLTAQGIVGIEGIDTRRLTKTIREHGVMNGMITQSLAGKARKLEEIRAFRVEAAPASTTCPEAYTTGEGRRVVLIDYGAKLNIVRELVRRGCEVTVVPCTTSAEDILAMKPQGIMLSNGGGDPADAKYEVDQIRKLNEAKIPTFGICLGHQLMALASGAKTHKLKYGHRGANQPVKDLVTGRVSITSQNHGYAVRNNSLPEGVGRVRMINVNDKTCEGIDYIGRPCFTVQFHPEAHGGPLDTEFLFDRFIEMIDKEGKNA